MYIPHIHSAQNCARRFTRFNCLCGGKKRALYISEIELYLNCYSRYFHLNENEFFARLSTQIINCTGNKASQIATVNCNKTFVQTTSFALFGTNTKRKHEEKYNRSNKTHTQTHSKRMKQTTYEEKKKKNSVVFSMNKQEDVVYLKMCIFIQIYSHLENPFLCLQLKPHILILTQPCLSVCMYQKQGHS